MDAYTPTKRRRHPGNKGIMGKKGSKRKDQYSNEYIYMFLLILVVYVALSISLQCIKSEQWVLV